MAPRRIKESSRKLASLVALNTVVSMVIAEPLLREAIKGESAFEAFIGIVPFVSHFFSLNLLVGIFLFVVWLLVPSRKLLAAAAFVLFGLLQTVLYVDVKVYALFHFHLNSLVWNIITTEGAGDSVVLGKGTFLTFVLTGALILAAEAAVLVASLRRSPFPGGLVARLFLLICVLAIPADKAIYAYGDLFNHTYITKTAKLYPLYQPFTVKRAASRIFKMDIRRESVLKGAPASGMLNYPKHPLAFDARAAKNYNIIVIIVEGLRWDMLDRQTMPRLSEFAAKSMTFENHYSGGNASRFGVFSLLYGLHGTYWHNILANRRSPVLIDALMERGYDFNVLSSTRLTFPEFRRTAFVRIPEAIQDSLPSGGHGRDRVMTDMFDEYLRNHGSGKPFFAFLFFNSSHQPYDYPHDFEKFTPVNDPEINYLAGVKREKAPLMRNRFKNSVYYEDFLIGKILDSIRGLDMLRNTVVVVTGDHGEEFFEDGYFGHTSSYDDYQTKSVFVMHYPGRPPEVVTRLTGHVDLAPTLLPMLGVVNPVSDYSQGVSLLGSKERPYVVVSGWDDAAIVDRKTKIVFSTELYGLNSINVYRSSDYARLKDQSAVLKRKKRYLLEVALQMSEFLHKK
jgi:membrane-anchored protein YejM (alkaline phosphatase superfamily)